MKQRILLVEDNENNRYLARYLLERAGFEIEVATDGKQGLEKARAGGFDLVILDIQMPEMDGYEVAAALRSAPATAHVPLVGVSSFAMAGDRAKAMRLGFAGYIEKPINPDTFAREIKGLLAGEHLAT